MKPGKINTEIEEMNNFLSFQLFDEPFDRLTFEEKVLLSKYTYDMTNQKWKPIILDGEESFYLVSNVGMVKNLRTGNVSNGSPDAQGYNKVHIPYNGKSNPRRIHRLVAEAFIPNPENKPQVNHIFPKHYNKKRKCDWVGNLEWATAKENVSHSIENGLDANRARGERGGTNKYTEEQIRMACKLLEDGYTSKEAARLVGIPKTTVDSIRCHGHWRHISKDYNIAFPHTYTVKRNYKYSDDTIHKVCQMIQEGYSGTEIFRSLKVPLPIVSSIKHGHAYTRISSQYDFQKVNDN